jgi:hypothetical protein
MGVYNSSQFTLGCFMPGSVACKPDDKWAKNKCAPLYHELGNRTQDFVIGAFGVIETWCVDKANVFAWSVAMRHTNGANFGRFGHQVMANRLTILLCSSFDELEETVMARPLTKLRD